MTKRSVIQTEQVNKRYGTLLALDDVSINVQRGEIYGFLGPNGAGKSTLINILLGLVKPTSGKVYIFDKLVENRQPELFLHIGIMGEEQHFYEDLTSLEYLELFAKLQRVRSAERRVQELLEKLSMWNWRDYSIKSLSHGMRQKVALARALLHRPELLILDEPATGLDPFGIKEVRNLLVELRQQGTTIFISSHILSEVERIADRVGILHKGSLLVEGSVESLIQQASEHTIIEVELSESNADLGKTLKKMPFVINVETRDNRLFIETNSNRDRRAEVSHAITSLGGVIIEMKVHKPTLEDTFITLTDKTLPFIAEMMQS